MDKNVLLNIEFLGPSQRVQEIANKLSQMWAEDDDDYKEINYCGYSCSLSKDTDRVEEDEEPGDIQVIVIKVADEEEIEELEEEEIDSTNPDWLQLLSEQYENEVIEDEEEIKEDESEIEKLNAKITTTLESIKKAKLERMETELAIEKNKLAEQQAYVVEVAKRKYLKKEMIQKQREYNATKISFLKALKSLHGDVATPDELALINKFRANYVTEANCCEVSAFGVIKMVPSAEINK